MSWIEQFDESKIREALEEACVDCYEPDEQSSGLFSMIDQELGFPFTATVIGETVEAVAVTSCEFDSLGVDIVVQRDGQKYSVAATSITPTDPLPEGSLYLAAYLLWKRCQ